MRLFMLPSSGDFCSKHLVIEHASTHLCSRLFQRGKRFDTYRGRNLLQLHGLEDYHDTLVAEMERRGMRHRSPFPEGLQYPNVGTVDTKQSSIELGVMCDECRVRLELNMNTGELLTAFRRLLEERNSLADEHTLVLWQLDQALQSVEPIVRQYDPTELETMVRWAEHIHLKETTERIQLTNKSEEVRWLAANIAAIYGMLSTRATQGLKLAESTGRDYVDTVVEDLQVMFGPEEDDSDGDGNTGNPKTN